MLIINPIKNLKMMYENLSVDFINIIILNLRQCLKNIQDNLDPNSAS